MTEKTASQIIHVDVEDLIPYARNARTHGAEQIQQIAASISAFGFNNPVLIDGGNGIVAGHGRVLAAQVLGMKTVPCVRVDWLNEAEKRAYILADNKIAENSGWDVALMESELEALADFDIPRELLGFEAEVEALPEVEQKPAVETGPVRDVFWINITGPLKNQADVIDRLRAVMADIEPVTVEMATVNRE